MPDAPVQPSLRQRLREATASSHAQVDALLEGGFQDRTAYQAYLAGMHGFVSALLPAVRPAAMRWQWPLPAWDDWLQHDLAHTGTVPLPAPGSLRGRSHHHALGVLYVLEGSALGARLLARQSVALGYAQGRGATFLHAHAEGEGGLRWRNFLTLLESEHPIHAHAAACEGAREAFDLAEHCLRSARERLS